MGRRKHLIPVETLKFWLKDALSLLKNSGKGGRFQATLFKSLRSGGAKIPSDEEFETEFLAVLSKQKGVRKIGEGSNPKWILFPLEIPEIFVPEGLRFVQYPGNDGRVAVRKTAPARVTPVLPKPTPEPQPVLEHVAVAITTQELASEVTLVDVITVAGPAVRVFMKHQADFVTRAQLETVAKEALGGRDLPENFFGNLCFVGHVTRRDHSKDEYFRSGGTRGPRKASAKKNSPTKPKLPQRGRPKKKQVAAPASASDVEVIQLPGITKLMFGSEKFLTVTMEGDLKPLLGIIELPFTIHGDAFSQVTLTHGTSREVLEKPWVMVGGSGGLSVGVGLSLDATLQINHISLRGPWRIAVFRQAPPK